MESKFKEIIASKVKRVKALCIERLTKIANYMIRIEGFVEKSFEINNTNLSMIRVYL